MPIYGYVCDQCGHSFEILQSVSDAPLRECPNCMGPLRKQLYPVGVIYKGSGFYTTDYKNAGSKSSSGSKSDSDGSAKSETKSESGGSETKSGGEGQSVKSDKSDTKASDKAAS